MKPKTKRAVGLVVVAAFCATIIALAGLKSTSYEIPAKAPLSQKTIQARLISKQAVATTSASKKTAPPATETIRPPAKTGQQALASTGMGHTLTIFVGVVVTAYAIRIIVFRKTVE